MSDRRLRLYARLRSSVLAILELRSIKIVVLLLKFAHLFNLIEVDNVACV